MFLQLGCDDAVEQHGSALAYGSVSTDGNGMPSCGTRKHFLKKIGCEIGDLTESNHVIIASITLGTLRSYVL